MLTYNLHKNWVMQQQGWNEWLSATVPGSVYQDLLDHGRMEDPYWRDNELKALPLMDYDYHYRTEFSVPEELLNSDEVLLHCDGLDTVADVYVNGTHVAFVDNMHRTWEWPVKSLLTGEQNRLEIQFHSPTKCIKERDAKLHAGGSTDAMIGYPSLRKTHCMFGWDWGPRLPDAGIWREIKLMGVDTARLISVYVAQDHYDGVVDLSLTPEIEKIKEGKISYRVILTAPDGTSKEYAGSPAQIRVENPQLWWPNGYGKQNLYQICVILEQDGRELDRWERRIGLRTMTICREKDQYGESFCHEVNGVKIFAMGADYIPEDNLFSRITPERTHHLLEQCKAAHFNAVRVWGGGYYPDDWFYDACDELGLMVWQDFMFACAVYNLTDEFEENVKQEIIDNVKRLRHHPSLGLWCGNNEMEQFVDEWEYDCTPRQKADYIKMYEYLIPKLLKEHDPQTFYWPASPSSGGSFDEPNAPDRGDVHYWAVWHGNKPFSDYRNYYFRYLSEFGFESFPCKKTVETFALEEDQNIFSYVMEKHQRCNGANGKIMNYLYQTFLYPTDFDTLLYASQLLQAEAIRYGVEHFRRNRGRCMGAIYWQLNDCWPVASWASIDYCGRWKALHYYAKRFFAPLMLSCCEEGILTQDTNVNAEPYDVKKSFRLNIANETMETQTATVKWQLRHNTSEIWKEGSCQVEVAPLSSLWLDEVLAEEADLYSDYVSYQLVQNGEVISSGSVLFGLPKHFHFQNPELSCRVEGDEIVVTAKAYAKSVEILNENQDLILSDNYFDMDAGERRVKVLSGDITGLTLRSVYDIR